MNVYVIMYVYEYTRLLHDKVSTGVFVPVTKTKKGERASFW